jgi:hypothetical protein
MPHSRSQYPKGWRDVYRVIILLRDEFKCVVCSLVSISNHVHHCDKDKQNNDPLNLVTLCPKCHRLLDAGNFIFKRKVDFCWSAHEELFNSYFIKASRMKL